MNEKLFRRLLLISLVLASAASTPAFRAFL